MERKRYTTSKQAKGRRIKKVYTNAEIRNTAEFRRAYDAWAGFKQTGTRVHFGEPPTDEVEVSLVVSRALQRLKREGVFAGDVDKITTEIMRSGPE